MDGIFCFVRGFLGIPGENRRNDSPQSPPENEFNNPICNMDEEDDDDDSRKQVPNSPFSFTIFSNPLEIHRFFEHQMQEILKQFQIDDAPSLFGEDIPALPPPGPEPDTSLRDEFLKPEYRGAFAPGYGKSKVTDSDLDDRVNSGELDIILKDKPSLEQPGTSEIPSPQGPTSFWNSVTTNFGKSVTKKVIRLGDGRIEHHHQTVEGSSGYRQTSVTRQFGDKSYTVTTRIGPDGTTKQSESLVNMDKSELAEFKKKWESAQTFDTDPEPLDWFPFESFFK